MIVSMTHDYQRLTSFLTGLHSRAVRTASLRAINRTLVSGRKIVSQEIRNKYRLPAGGGSEGGRGRTPPGVGGMIKLDKPSREKGLSLLELKGMIKLSDKPISMIHFVRGSKEPPLMAGIPVKRRRVARVDFPKGVLKKLTKGMFIQEAKGAVHVWRKPDSGSQWHKQSVPSVYRLLEKPDVRRPVLKKITDAYQRTFSSELSFHINRERERNMSKYIKRL